MMLLKIFLLIKVILSTQLKVKDKEEMDKQTKDIRPKAQTELDRLDIGADPRRNEQIQAGEN